MRLPHSAHTAQPWRVHELAPDFRLEDVWGMRAPDQAGAFRAAVALIAASDPSQSPSLIVRTLFAIRWKLGELFGLDDDGGAAGAVPSLRERLPADLREHPGPEFTALPFTSLYLLEDEFAAETANETMHGILHLGLVGDGAGAAHGQMAVLVKPNGLFGSAYMAAIRPFRHLLVYPPMLRAFERDWRAAARAGDHRPSRVA